MEGGSQTSLKHVPRGSSMGTLWLILGARKSNVSTEVSRLIDMGKLNFFNTPLTQASKGTYSWRVPCFQPKKSIKNLNAILKEFLLGLYSKKAN